MSSNHERDEQGERVKASHTPGPWRIEKVEGEGFRRIVAGSKRRPIEIADVWAADRLQREIPTEANARLIAAAPDMLAALREIEVICSESVGDCRKRMGTRTGNSLVTALAAIAKATGA